MKQENGFKPMDKETKKRMTALAKKPDAEIDTSDIKEWSNEDFLKAVPFQNIYKPKKEQITTRIDADILLWLKSHGKGYQTLLNDLLRKEMMEELWPDGNTLTDRKQYSDAVHEKREDDYNAKNK